MKQIRFFIAITLSLMAFTSCAPKISVKANANGGADVVFKTGFSDSTASTLRTISGLPANSPIFSTDDIKEILTQAGIQRTVVRTPTSVQVESSGFIPNKPSELSKAKIFSQTANSLSITLGPNQLKDIYSHIDTESQKYFDMMMIPALIGEEMDAEEYRQLLSAMYGTTFANELVDGKLSISLTSPNGKKTTNAQATLGEILTLTKEKTWTVTW
ncbi:MAG: hypothetical protein II921_06460 [Treponema sp.]|nr:hypothetical protein [Treponema sp.]